MADIGSCTIEMRLQFLMARTLTWRERIVSLRPWRSKVWEVATEAEILGALDRLTESLARLRRHDAAP